MSDLTPLRELRSPLKYLFLRGTLVQDISAVSTLTELQWLDLDDTSVKTVEPLQANLKLMSLSLRNTGVSDVTPLQLLPYLDRLVLDGVNFDLKSLDGLANKYGLYIQLAQRRAYEGSVLQFVREAVNSGEGVLGQARQEGLPEAGIARARGQEGGEIGELFYSLDYWNTHQYFTLSSFSPVSLVC